VVGVRDGDTISVLDGAKERYTISLEGIDAPESAQVLGVRARNSLSDLVYGKTVTVTRLRNDRYGRVVGKVTLEAAALFYQQGVNHFGV